MRGRLRQNWGDECLPNSSRLNRWHVEECFGSVCQNYQLSMAHARLLLPGQWEQWQESDAQSVSVLGTVPNTSWPTGQPSTCRTLRGHRGHAQTYTHMYSVLYGPLSWQGYVSRESSWHETHISIGLQWIYSL